MARVAAVLIAVVLAVGRLEAQPAISPNSTRVPPAPSIVDTAGDVWTIGAAGSLARNGIASGGTGSVLWWLDGVLYALGTNQNWYQWSGYWFGMIGTPMPAAVVPINGVLEFSMRAPSLVAAQGYVYRATIDDVGIGVVPVICRGPVTAPGFPCVMKFPPVGRGRGHRLVMTASDTGQSSKPSETFWFVLMWPGAAVPAGLRVP